MTEPCGKLPVIPPTAQAGWSPCGRDKGHEGPCAHRPIVPEDVLRYYGDVPFMITVEQALEAFDEVASENWPEAEHDRVGARESFTEHLNRLRGPR